jgi:RNA recognition motif-containing protein
MAVLDDETAKAVGVGQKIHEEVDDHEDDDHRGDSGTEVFVGGIPPEANERDVGDAFSRFGKVSKVRLFDMQSYGFVKFYGVKSAAAAVKHYEGCDGTGNNPIEDPVLICDAPVSIVEFAASGKDLVIQKAKEIATKKREGESVEEDEAAKAKAREVMTYEAI